MGLRQRRGANPTAPRVSRRARGGHQGRDRAAVPLHRDPVGEAGELVAVPAVRLGRRRLRRAERNARDGSFGFDLTAQYTEVTPMKSMSYTLGEMKEYFLDAGRVVDITFEETSE